MAHTVTHVHMTARDQLNPSAAVAGLRLESVPETSPLIPETLSRVGAAYGWKSARRTQADWEAWFAESARKYSLIMVEADVAGIVVWELHPGDEVEIKSFGLLPEKVGKGLGGFALTLAIRHAWDLQPDVTRVWLHTSSKDHPGALPNYLRRGFSAFSERTDPDPAPDHTAPSSTT